MSLVSTAAKGAAITTTDGSTSVAATTILDFTSGATVSAGVTGTANVAIAAGGPRAVQLAPANPDASGNGYAALVVGSNVRSLVPAFVKDVVGDWWGIMRIPSDYASAAAIKISLAANATTGVTTMGLASRVVANAALYDGALTSESDIDVTVPGTAYTRVDATWTLSTTCVAGSDLIYRIRHNGTAVNDTLAVDTLMFNAVLQYTAG